MKTFIRRFSRMQTLSKIVVVGTAALMVTGCVLVAVGSPLALPALLATGLPFPAGLVYERFTQG